MKTEAISDSKAKWNIGQNLRYLRGGHSLQHLADLCTTPEWNCYPSTIEQIEKGRHLPRAGVIARVAYGLSILLERRVLVDELFLDVPKERPKRRRAVKITVPRSQPTTSEQHSAAAEPDNPPAARGT